MISVILAVAWSLVQSLLFTQNSAKKSKWLTEVFPLREVRWDLYYCALQKSISGCTTCQNLRQIGCNNKRPHQAKVSGNLRLHRHRFTETRPFSRWCFFPITSCPVKVRQTGVEPGTYHTHPGYASRTRYSELLIQTMPFMCLPVPNSQAIKKTKYIRVCQFPSLGEVQNCLVVTWL